MADTPLSYASTESLSNKELLKRIEELTAQARFQGEALYDRKIKVDATRLRNTLMAIVKAAKDARIQATTFKATLPTNERKPAAAAPTPAKPAAKTKGKAVAAPAPAKPAAKAPAATKAKAGAKKAKPVAPVDDDEEAVEEDDE